LLLQAALMAVFAATPILLIAEPLTALHRRGLFLPAFGREAYDRVINMIVGPLFSAAVIGSVAVAGRWLDHRRFEDFGVRIDRSWWRDLGFGLALGGLLMAAVFAIELAAGWVAVTGFARSSVADVALGLLLSFSVTKVLCVGVYEEFVSRGYHLRNLTEGTNLPTAIVVSSAVFALLHALNDNATVLSTVGLFVNALLFAAGWVATGQLSLSIGLHIAWNFFEGVVFGFPVSGDKEGASVVAILQNGPPLLTGGAFGPEGGLLGIAASLLGVAVIARRARRRAATPAG
jgi:membrane protease YdiL (CAAX protease family)